MAGIARRPVSEPIQKTVLLRSDFHARCDLKLRCIHCEHTFDEISAVALADGDHAVPSAGLRWVVFELL